MVKYRRISGLETHTQVALGSIWESSSILCNLGYWHHGVFEDCMIIRGRETSGSTLD